MLQTEISGQKLFFKTSIFQNENDVLFQKVTQAYSEKKSECSYQESNLRPSDY